MLNCAINYNHVKKNPDIKPEISAKKICLPYLMKLYLIFLIHLTIILPFCFLHDIKYLLFKVSDLNEINFNLIKLIKPKIS